MRHDHDLKHYIVDIAAAFSAAALVSPIVAIIDKAIVSHASGKQNLWVGIKQDSLYLLKRPLSFYREPFCLYICGVYFGTYVVANLVETYCVQNDMSWHIPKFISTSITNSVLSIAKDRIFARKFGIVAPASFPLQSYALLLTRDSLTMAAAFNVPTLLAKELEQNYSMPSNLSFTVAQLLTPVAVQLFTTPLHLSSLDFYNRRNVSLKSRFQFVKAEYWKTCFVRMIRIFPPFGIGGLGNSYFKYQGRKLLKAYSE